MKRMFFGLLTALMIVVAIPQKAEADWFIDMCHQLAYNGPWAALDFVNYQDPLLASYIATAAATALVQQPFYPIWTQVEIDTFLEGWLTEFLSAYCIE